MDIFVGIDVAFAKKKRLPIAAGRYLSGKFEPLELKIAAKPPPVGRGNLKALREDERKAFAEEVAIWLVALQRSIGAKIQRVAIDSPRDYANEIPGRRCAERTMDERGIRCFATPTRKGFEKIERKCMEHIKAGGAESSLPAANQIWMLVGFSLFKRLERDFECIEVYPNAALQILGCGGAHKSTKEGLDGQIAAVEKRLSYPAGRLKAELPRIAYGHAHDKLDALISAWIGSLAEDERVPCGKPPNDVIWLPIQA